MFSNEIRIEVKFSVVRGTRANCCFDAITILKQRCLVRRFMTPRVNENYRSVEKIVDGV